MKRFEKVQISDNGVCDMIDWVQECYGINTRSKTVGMCVMKHFELVENVARLESDLKNAQIRIKILERENGRK